MRVSFPLLAVATLTLAACEPIPAPEPQPEAPGASDACGASGYQGLIGQRGTVLESMTFPLRTRVIGPNDAITADYSPERLNIEIGLGGLIERVACY
ncbi:I78 family peptidase inhibitor (plasmid) [Paracoccus sp. TK19116]|uniref:I78 family peptidase inhibitor n=1 Tax=Paracoccus albicereus TaxID=2922394 RepID=A0ABT1MMD8_9RHOB|nr:I78 family peptidase inhibitor [Paracoccus albicereus]MCQ0969437.1 I78 family peptidase inhibitor [Paracoccus albicereus]